MLSFLLFDYAFGWYQPVGAIRGDKTAQANDKHKYGPNNQHLDWHHANTGRGNNGAEHYECSWPEILFWHIGF